MSDCRGEQNQIKCSKLKSCERANSYMITWAWLGISSPPMLSWWYTYMADELFKLFKHLLHIVIPLVEVHDVPLKPLASLLSLPD